MSAQYKTLLPIYAAARRFETGGFESLAFAIATICLACGACQGTCRLIYAASG